MNIVGKMLVVLQLIFSVLFMCFAGAVYSHQAAWKGKADTLQNTISSLQTGLDAANTARTQEAEAHNVALEAETNRANALQATATTAQQDVVRLTGELNSVREQLNEKTTEAEIAAAEARDRKAESDELNVEVQNLRDRVNEQLTTIRTIEDRILSLSGTVNQKEEKERSDLAQISRLMALLRSEGIDPRKIPTGPIPDEIEPANGVVEGTQMNDSRSTQFVQVSIGSDDRVVRGQTLTISRGGQFIADIKVTSVGPDVAIGVVNESTRNGNVQEGDYVTTRI